MLRSAFIVGAGICSIIDHVDFVGKGCKLPVPFVQFTAFTFSIE